MEQTTQRPVVFFDLETTGTNISKDRIVEIAMIKVEVIDGETSTTQMQSYFNPEIPMHPEAAIITGLTDDFLKDFSSFKIAAPGIFEFLKGCDLAGHNIIGFDVPILVEEFLRCSYDFPAPDVSFIDTFQIQAKLFPRTLEFVYETLTGKKVDKDSLHGAMADTKLSVEVFNAQIENFADQVPNDRAELHKISTRDRKILDYAGRLTVNESGEIIYTFGKNEGKSVASDPNYAAWVLGGDFTLDTKRWIQHAMRNKGKLQGQSRLTFN